MRHIGFAFLSAALLIVGSCGEPPTRPTPVTNPPPPSAEISVGEITPGSGSTLVFRDCGQGDLCTDQLRTAFEVLVPVDIPNAVVIVSLRRGSTPCAWAFVARALNGGDRTSFSTSSMEVVSDEEGLPLCSLPTDTISLAFQVFHPNAPAQAFLSRELPYRYTLAAQ